MENPIEVDGSEKIKINPYNFNNKLLTNKDVNNILSNFDINEKITNLCIYQQAFVHKSYCKKNPEEINDDVELAEKPEGCLELQDNDNERLEFLGDSIISATVAKYLYERYSDQDEGFLTRIRTKLVNGESLGDLAKKLDFGKYMLISRHVEERCNGRNSLRILEDVFESFIGSMFLDFNESRISDHKIFDELYSGIGFQIAEKFIINVIERFVDFTELILKDYNYKDQLLRFFQQKFQQTPKYKELMVEGPPHDRIFTMCVMDTNGEVISEGKGKSKKKAEQLASMEALIKFKVIDRENVTNEE